MNSIFRSIIKISFLTIILNSFTVLIRSQQILRISPSGESINEPANQQFVLTCKGEGAEPNWFSNLKWFDPRNEEITPTYTKDRNPDIRVEELQFGHLLLHFLNPNPDNSGKYKCSGIFQHSDTLNANIQINFFQDVSWDDCPEIQALIKGNSGERIRCKASAHPKPNISWMKEDKALDNDPRYNIDSNGIKINNQVNESDGGVFRVRALVTETGRLHDKYITVQIHVKPEILDSFPNSFEGTEGEQATLQCKASGSEPKLYTWLDPNRRNLSSVGGYTVDRNSGALIINKVRKYEDNGSFTCIAENLAGKSEKLTQFIVIRRPIITSFQNISFDEYKQSKFECRTTGDPKPKITIRKDGNSREFTIGDPRISFEEKIENEETVLQLWIQNTERNDDGLYFCRAENRGGTVERVGHLEVRFKPDLRRTPLTTVKTWDFHPINITCIADAIPNATIKWYFRGQELLNGFNNIYQIYDNNAGLSRLFINPLSSPGSSHKEIYGQYRCEGSNSLGRSELNIQLDQAFRPASIMEVKHEKITPTTITFKLFAPSFDGGLPIKTIHVQYREEEKQWDSMITKKWPFNTLNGQTQSQHEFYYLDNLKPRTKYIFRFAAENDVGIGDFSTEKVLMTERESRPDTPKFHNLPFDTINKQDIISQFSDKFLAEWNLPADNGREIKYFEIKYYPVRKSESGFEAIGFDHKLESVSYKDESLTSYTLKNLKPNTYYRLELRAYNDLGFSDTESIVFRTNINGDNAGLNEDHYDNNSSLKTSSFSLGLIIGIIIIMIIVLLILMDIYFYFRYRVGVFYFLKTHIFCNEIQNQRRISSEENKHVQKNEESFHDQIVVNEHHDNPCFDQKFHQKSKKVVLNSNSEFSPMIIKNGGGIKGDQTFIAKDSAV